MLNIGVVGPLLDLLSTCDTQLNNDAIATLEDDTAIIAVGNNNVELINYLKKYRQQFTKYESCMICTCPIIIFTWKTYLIFQNNHPSDR